MLFFKQWRNPDNVSIAGGEPLIHPQIVDIVAFIAQNGIKPIILTNAVALTPETVARAEKGRAGRFHHPHRQPPEPAALERQDRGRSERAAPAVCRHGGRREADCT